MPGPSHIRAFLPALGMSLAVAAGCNGGNRPASEFPSADVAIDQMQEQFACVNGLQGEAKIDDFSPQGRVRGDVYLIAVNPARVRLDVVSPFGVNLYTLASDGREFQMLDLKEKQFLFGPAKACNLARLTQVPVPGHALVSLLRGEAPVLVHTEEQARLDWEGGQYKITLDSLHRAQEEIRLEVHPDDFNKPYAQQRLRVREVVVRQAGTELYRATLDDHEPAKTAPPRVDPDGLDDDIAPSGGPCGAEIPQEIRIEVPHTEHDVLFEYEQTDWNPPLVQGAFSLVEPGGVTAMPVDCRD